MKWYSRTSPRSLARFQPSVGFTLSGGMGMAALAGRRLRMAVVMVRRRLRLAHHDEASVGGPQHLYRQAVELGQRLAGDHLLDRPLDGMTAGQVDDSVDVRQQRVDVVGDEQHPDA